MSDLIELALEGGDWAAFGDVAAVAERAATAALAAAGVDAVRVSVSLLCTDDAAIAALNHRFRGQDKPTNVLSWPAAELRPAEPGARPTPPTLGADRTALGDVALAAGVIAREALEKDVAPDAHLAHLIAHGVLHLLGFDHETDADAAVMEGLERLALGRLGIADPYA